MYGEVVEGIDAHCFEHALEELKAERDVENDVDLTAFDLMLLIKRFKRIYEDEAGHPFPADAHEQLHARRARRLRLLELAAGARLPAAPTRSRMTSAPR